MIVTARAFWAPKAGNRPEEYEDAFWPSQTTKRTGKPARGKTAGHGHGKAAARAEGQTPGSGADGGVSQIMRFAVADGATETSFAGLWARQLVAAFGRGCFDGNDWLADLRREQSAWYAEVLQKPLPWYAEEKVHAGAYAALLGLELAANGSWRSLAVGDCCLFHWREEGLVTAFPAQEASFFTSRPYLLSSSAAHNGGLEEQVLRSEGQWLPGDRFALLSDALAQWALRELEAGSTPWPALAQLQAGDRRHFTRWVEGLRSSAALRNDDVTALLIALA